MRIGLLARKLPPERCGVGDHASELTRALRDLGHNARALGPEDLRLPIAFRSLAQTVRNARSLELDALIIQYTPSLMLAGGLGLLASGPALEAFVAAVRRGGRTRVILNAHEIHYPIEASLPGLALGIPQLVRFKSLSRLCDAVVFTYEAAFERHGRARDLWLPVGSNIPAVPVAGASEIVRKRWPRLEKRRILAHFGGFHPTHHFPHQLAALEASADCALLMVGSSGEDLARQLERNGASALSDRIVATGYLSSEDVSLCLQAADLVLAPFMDGVSSRRGSVMAALAHGKAVVTNSGWATGMSIPWGEFVLLAPDSGLRSFVDQVRLALNCPPAERSLLGQRARERFERSFSWPVLAQRWVETISR